MHSLNMPIYEYEHMATPCRLGMVFEVRQSIHEAPLTRCPQCRASVKKLMSRVAVSMPKTNRELKDLGFTKLVRRDDGVYENVTVRHGESRVMVRGRPETIPNIGKTIQD
jgi:putative FmdB family regulatory protein